VCFALLESGALFTGDHVMGWSTTVVSPPDGDMAAYMHSLAKLQAREDLVYYPAHGPAVTKPQQLVRGMIGHRRQREAQILRVLGEGSATIPKWWPRCSRGLIRGSPARPGDRCSHIYSTSKRRAESCADQTHRNSHGP